MVLSSLFENEERKKGSSHFSAHTSNFFQIKKTIINKNKFLINVHVGLAKELFLFSPKQFHRAG